MDSSKFIQSDIIDYVFDKDDKYESAIIGFLLGYFIKEQDDIFFSKLKSILKPGSKILIIDSIWTKERAKTQNKEGISERFLNDGRSFTIYKKYFDENDLPSLLNLTICQRQLTLNKIKNEVLHSRSTSFLSLEILY